MVADLQIPLLIWCAISISGAALVVWMEGPHGWKGALARAFFLIAIAVGFSIATMAPGPGLQFLYVLLIAPPLIVGVVAGLALRFLLNGARLPGPR
jgi:hypothetical protein